MVVTFSLQFYLRLFHQRFFAIGDHREMRVHPLHLFQHYFTHKQVGIPFIVRRYHISGRFRSAGMPYRVLVGLVVLAPVAALGNIVR